MSLNKLIGNYAAYNEWANKKMVSWLLTLNPDLLYKESPSSFKSIDFTIQHMLRTQTFWLLFISGQDTSQLNRAVRTGEAEQVLKDLLANSEAMSSRFGLFTETELTDHLNLDMPWAKNNLSRYEYIVHVINHSTFHRGQVITLAPQRGHYRGAGKYGL